MSSWASSALSFFKRSNSKGKETGDSRDQNRESNTANHGRASRSSFFRRSRRNSSDSSSSVSSISSEEGRQRNGRALIPEGQPGPSGTALPATSPYAVLFDGPLRVRDRLGMSWTDYHCVLTLDKRLRGYVDRESWKRDSQPSLDVDIAEVLDWDGKGRTHEYTNGFRIRLYGGGMRECVADNMREQIKWMKFIRAVTDPESAAGQLLKRMKNKEERLLREQKKRDKLARKRAKEKKKLDKISAEIDKQAFATYQPAGQSETVSEMVDPLRRRTMAMRNMRTARNKLHKAKRQAAKERKGDEEEAVENVSDGRSDPSLGTSTALVVAPTDASIVPANEARRKTKKNKKGAKSEKKKEEEEEDEFEDLFGAVTVDAAPVPQGKGLGSGQKKARRKKKKQATTDDASDDYEDLFGGGDEATKTVPKITKKGTAKAPVAVPVKDDPRFAHYFRLLSIGLPKAAVQRKMDLEGADSSVLDMDPNSPYTK